MSHWNRYGCHMAHCGKCFLLCSVCLVFSFFQSQVYYEYIVMDKRSWPWGIIIVTATNLKLTNRFSAHSRCFSFIRHNRITYGSNEKVMGTLSRTKHKYCQNKNTTEWNPLRLFYFIYFKFQLLKLPVQNRTNLCTLIRSKSKLANFRMKQFPQIVEILPRDVKEPEMWWRWKVKVDVQTGNVSSCNPSERMKVARSFIG